MAAPGREDLAAAMHLAEAANLTHRCGCCATWATSPMRSSSSSDGQMTLM